jgi:two-component system, cell cycle sensor histidine kinase and response regulator CckA
MSSVRHAHAGTEDRADPPPTATQPAPDAPRMEAIGRMVGGVAHDFNNLLTGIMLYCDLLLAGLSLTGSRIAGQEDEKRFRHYVEEIRRASESGGALLQQLLAAVRRQPTEPQLLSLNAVILATGNLLSRLVGENIELATDLADDLGTVKMDPAHAQQIILNLVLNARDAMPGGGPITVVTRNCAAAEANSGPSLTGASVELSVTDSGSGMSAETRARLFERYFTTKAPGRGNGGGNGLGLATVHSIVEHYGGTIQVESDSGKGTRIIIHFPRCAEKTEVQPQPVPISPGETATPSSPSPKPPKSQHRRGAST